MKLNKVISSVLAFAMAISIVPATTFAAETVTTTLYEDDFESYDVSAYPKPKPDGLTITGDSDSVYVDTVGTSNRLWLQNDGFVKSVEVGRTFTQINGKTVTFELDFLQLYNTSEGDTILGVYSGDSPALLVQTSGGDIVATTYSSGSGKVENVVLVDGYMVNRAYKIKAVVDLFDQSSVIHVDGEAAGTTVLTDTSGTADNFRISAKQLPGFAVDNVKVYLEEGINSVAMTGTEELVIPVEGTTEYEYSAQVYDANGTAVDTVELEWSLSGEPLGVTILNPTGKTVKVSVPAGAEEKTFTIKAKVRGAGTSGTLSLKTVPLSATTLEITGWQDKVEILDKSGNKSYITYPSYRITGDDREVKTYKFKAAVLDQFGNEVEEFGTYTWQLFAPAGEPNVPDGVTINASNGVITVKGNPKKEQKIGIRVTSDRDTSIYGETEVSVLDLDTYAMDKIRFDAVIEHIETSLESASVDGSPLLSDIFVRGDRSPARILESLKDTVESNVMSQSNLMRAMYNLSVITGNDKYKDRVDEIYKLMMTDGLMANGIQMSWGGHLTMDAETNSPFSTYNSGTHEIKGVSPFITPMFGSANTDYAYDDYANGYGLGGFLFRAMISGHSMGNYDTLDFERHWSTAEDGKAFEPVWKTPEVFDDDRRGPAQRSGGAPFSSCAANLLDILITYYDTTEDDYGLAWAENFMNTVLNSSFTYYVYKDVDDNLIWPSDTTNMDYYATEKGAFGDEPKREYYNKHNELVYTSVKSDIQPMSDTVSTANYIYEHRDVAEFDGEGKATDIVKVIDVKTGEETELTLYNTWTDGSWGEMATMIGDHYKLDAVSENLGYIWYLHSDYKDIYGGTGYGDRFYNQVVTGTPEKDDKDTWVEQGLITEEEGSLMIDPYARTRGLQTYGEILLAMCEAVEALNNGGKEDSAIEALDKCSKGVYNDIKRSYSFTTDTFWSYMSWLRPEYMRSNEIASYKDSYKDVMESYDEDSEEYKFWEKYGELPWNVEIPSGGKNGRSDDINPSLRNKMYFRANAELNNVTHRGYYGDPGEVTFGEKRTEPVIMSSYIYLCGTLSDAIERLEATDPSDENYTANIEKAEVFRNRVKYIWKVLRDMFSEKAPVGEIGEDFFNLDPDLDLATSSNSYKMVELMISAYKATENEEFLKMARAIANNWMRSNYAANEQMFTSGSDFFGTVSNDMLQILLELDALLLGRFDENIPHTSLVRGEEFYDTYIYHEDGRYMQNISFVNTPSSMYANDSVVVQEVNILHDVIELNVGETMKIEYEVLPWDAGSKGVLWDVYDQRVAMMDTDTQTLYALKKGKTKIRCVSTSRTGIESKEVEVIVK